MINALLESIPAARAKGWRKATMEAFASDEDHEFHPLLTGLKLIPDAYVIERDERELHFFEVEVCSPMSRHKLRSYGKFAIDLAYYEINFALFTVNQHGHLYGVDLMPHYADWLASQQGPKS